MNNLDKLAHWFQSRPLIVLKFEDGFLNRLSETLHGFDMFTIAKSHRAFDDLRVPTLCLAEFPNGQTLKHYVGVVKSKTPISTFDSRITIIKLRPLNLKSFDDLAKSLEQSAFQKLFRTKLESEYFATSLSPKLSVAIIDELVKSIENRRAIEATVIHIPSLRETSAVEWEQLDAIKIAMAAFGISKSELPDILNVSDDSDSTLAYFGSQEAHALEDNVIGRDANFIPGFDLVDKFVTGRAVFFKRGERLDVYTANKGPLEEMLGVDLIYINETVGSVVMVQYKMLMQQSDSHVDETDWIFRPDDQFELEVERMKLPPVQQKFDDYRLNNSPFFFKFVKRKGNGEAHASFIISLEHLKRILNSPDCEGPRGGVRISFNHLKGIYLREMDLLGLISSGYIGTHRVETNAIKPFVQGVAEGKRALVFAWHKLIERAEDA